MIKKGKLIAFIGVDGSGKTTQSNILLKEMRYLGKTAVTRKIFSFFIISLFIKILKKHKPYLKENEKAISRKRLGKNFVRQVFLYFAVLDCWLYYLFRVLPILYKYDYVISDRYFYDYAPNLLRLGIGNYHNVFWFINHLPKPDYCFYLNLSGKNAFQRKKGFTLSYLNMMVELYNNLFVGFKGIIEIEADARIEDLKNKIQKNILLV